ncbi:MAG TPA: glycosyltransferase [Solirubrobacteraceae bacterium]|nr:glycosyltransferase [Solirubrobacteraceae bacterium]
MTAAPLVSVVVASHERPRRLAVLLDALAAQTAPTELWEVLVVHDSSGSATDDVLRGHPLAGTGRLRWERFPESTGTAARMRNAGWRAARGRFVAFTDDDCRPDGGWLAAALRVARDRPTAILQGSTRPDPREHHLFGPTSFTHYMDPPTAELEACNALYPREVLERVGGFDESIRAYGEDVDLALRAKRAGAGHLAVPEMRMYHAIHPLGLRQRLALTTRCSELPAVVGRNPEFRWVPEHPLGVFNRPRHAWLVVALAGLALTCRRPALGLLALPYLWTRLHPYGQTTGQRLRRAHWLGPFALIDGAELLAFARGSIRHRTLFL